MGSNSRSQRDLMSLIDQFGSLSRSPLRNCRNFGEPAPWTVIDQLPPTHIRRLIRVARPRTISSNGKKQPARGAFMSPDKIWKVYGNAWDWSCWCSPSSYLKRGQSYHSSRRAPSGPSDSRKRQESGGAPTEQTFHSASRTNSPARGVKSIRGALLRAALSRD